MNKRVDRGPNLAKEVSQAHTRAILYKLKDDGGIKWSRDKRSRKDRRRSLKLEIAEMEKRLNGPEERVLFGRTIRYDKVQIQQRIERLRTQLQELNETSDQGAPRVIAPMPRRVAREDRRRSRG